MLYHVKEAQVLNTDYIQFGSGKKILLMIQGLNTNGIKGAGFSLAYMYRLFLKDYTVYLFDRRKEVDEHITVRDMARDIASVMDELSLKKADVIGVSQGGMIAQYLAIDRPDLVHKLVLAVTLSKNNDIVEKVINEWIRMVKEGDIKHLVLDMTKKMYSNEYIKRYRLLMPLLTIMQKPKDSQRFITLSQACLTCNSYELLNKIQCPTLVIGGRRDQIVGGFASEEIAQKLGCEIYMYEHLGHGAYEEAKDFNKKVYHFLKE